MPRHLPRRSSRPSSLLVPALLAALVGCQSDATTAPRGTPTVHLAQGDNGVWTVNTLADPGNGSCDDAECTLREAIAAAPSGGKIVFASGLQGDVALTAGQLSIDRSLTIDGGGRIAVNAQGTSRIVALTGAPTAATPVTLAGLTLKNGSASSGGAILVGAVTLTLDSVTLVSNQSSASGGAISLTNGPNGVSTVNIRNSIVANNSAATDGGGLSIVQGATVTITNAAIEGNSASGFAGGIFNVGTLTLTSSTLSGNNAGSSGGAFYNDVGGSMTVVESTISGNDAGVLGASAFHSKGALVVRSTTVTRNVAGEFGAIILTTSAATFANSIVAGNGNGYDCTLFSGGSITSLGHNLGSALGGCQFTGSGDVQVAGSQIFTEVLETDLKDNGGPTKTHALIARGLAVDAGFCPGEIADQRGFKRPVDDAIRPNAADACDIGAYEAQGPVLATADLMVSEAVDKTSVKQGDQLTYSVRVRNLGPQTAPNVVLTNVLSSGVTFVSARVNNGTITAPPQGETGTVTWKLGDMLDQANEVAEIKVTVIVRGKTTITNSAAVTGDVADPNAANNSAAITVSIASGGGTKS